jgi:transposase-like protein
MGARHYSEGFKARMVERMAAPGGPLLKDLSAEVNVPSGTLSRWRIEARLDGMGKKESKAPKGGGAGERDPRSTRDWSPAEKLRVVVAAAPLKDEELGEFLRREGIHLDQLEQWRSDVLEALGQAPRRPDPRRDPGGQQVRELEREILRKDKALAEVTALLVLRKKLEALFGESAEEGSSTDDRNGKK